MTYEEAKNLFRFDELCNCGGFAASMNGRDPDHPHMAYCRQYAQWEEWHTAIKKGETK